MKLLIVSQYFWPETFVINDLAKTLMSQGHSVVVATGKPCYPGERVFDGYQAAGVQREIYGDAIEVIRVPLRPRGTGALDLFRNYMSFVWHGLKFPRLLRGYEFDAILVFTLSPVTSAIPAIVLKWTKRAHLALWIQDMWPESLEATGYVRNRAALLAVGGLVRAIYAAADTLLVQSRAFVEPIARRARRDKILYFPNSVQMIAPAKPDEAALPADLLHALDTRFCIVFGGNMGSVQSVETIIEAACLLRDLPDVRIVFVGSGSMFEWVRNAVREHGLDQHVILAGRMPPALMPEIYERAAGLLVTLKDHEISAYTVPSKIQAYLAAGKPIIGALNGEGARVINEAGAGLTCAAEDATALAGCVRSLYGMSSAERSRIGAAGHRYFLEHFEMERQARTLTALLEQRIAATQVRR